MSEHGEVRDDGLGAADRPASEMVFPLPPQLPERPTGRRRGCWLACCFFFVLLCVVAAIANWYRSKGVFELPRLDTSWPLPDTDRPGEPPAPQPTPHVLPDTVEGVTRVLAPVMKQRFAPKASELDVQWPPARVRLVGLKLERSLELWVADVDGSFRLLKTYPVLAASGDLGPKRRQGDYQVPEGHYRMVYMNPKSKFHLSLLLDYPNAQDKAREKDALEAGKKLGGDICVHGSNISVGCLAIGDSAIEEVFTMVALAKPAHRDIVIMPADFRKRPDLITFAGEDESLLELYTKLTRLADTVREK